jgi:hypothetical protein
VHEFFRHGRWRGDERAIERLTRDVFDVAYFWRLDPAAVMALSVDEFLLYAEQAERIAAILNPT